ncbi:hypothetical protein PUW24_01525 [Paenibacillus urinalis]|uniref:HTH merR-type domain-containing protein n=1 Tax=Paenibacillus urinalis TaxID=521520 RepID=A0AAX3MVM8_9BACL|nr:hypothetical protein [Paenibacillus urinalis]WDH81663.1 hypothetical protein PUW23_19400 [Paenibacillus urinalis]WDH97709.1 hypothetical protein PUW24_01525 [Paenibacillus urinalis]WDI01384.1 hypothetical protein PUW25_19255 [Paenibacillus urinalis]
MHNRDRYPIRVDIEKIMEQLGMNHEKMIDYIDEQKNQQTSCKKILKPVYLSHESEKNE